MLFRLKKKKRNFKHLNCPACGKQLVNLMSKEAREAGFHHFWCDVCDIDVNIDENTTPPRSIYDDYEDEVVAEIGWGIKVVD